MGVFEASERRCFHYEGKQRTLDFRGYQTAKLCLLKKYTQYYKLKDTHSVEVCVEELTRYYTKFKRKT